MATRLCASCQQEKTIRGVWYLTPAMPGSSFVCETCFRGEAPIGAEMAASGLLG